jgi:hypothetical protein
VVIATSFAAQCHAGYVPSALALGGLATVGTVRARRAAPIRRPVAVAALCGAVLWAPVAWGTFVTHDGNLAALVRHFTTGGRKHAGWSTALRILGAQWHPWIPGTGPIGAAEPVTGTRLGGVVVGLLIVAALVAARREPRPAIRALPTVLAVLFPVALLSVAAIDGPLFGYLVRWTWVIGTLLVTAILALASRPLASRTPARVRRLGIIAGALAVLVAGLVGIRPTAADPADGVFVPAETQQAESRALARQVLRRLPAGLPFVMLEDRSAPDVLPGLALALERAHVPVRVADLVQVPAFGQSRYRRCGTPAPVLHVRARPPAGPLVRGRRIASWSRAGITTSVWLRPHSTVPCDGCTGTEPVALIRCALRDGDPRGATGARRDSGPAP